MKQNRISFNKTALLIALAGALTTQTVQAANWLMLQGTEADHQAPRAHLWGFVQADYQHTSDTKLPNGGNAAFNQMAPQQTSASGFNIKRARLAVRGANLPLDKNINYFMMAEFGNNGITTGGKGSAGQLTDASVTFNHIPGARVRVGLFKTPGSEESFKAIPVFNYVNYTSGTDRLLIERKVDKATGKRPDPVYAARDTGLQVFDSFKFGEWEHSYAVMLGNGNGLSMSDDNNDRDLYLYASTEKYFGENKAGPRSKSMKFYAWSQSGKRNYGPDKFDRDRKGLGMTYFDGKYRAAAEYVKADGMIFGGPAGGAAGGALSVQTNQKADAYHVDLGYRVTPKAELNVRYDRLDSGTDNANKAQLREFTTTTLGAQYFLNLKTSVRLNYEIRNIDAPHAQQGAKNIVDKIDNRVSAQVTMVF